MGLDSCEYKVADAKPLPDLACVIANPMCGKFSSLMCASRLGMEMLQVFSISFFFSISSSCVMFNVSYLKLECRIKTAMC